MSLGYIYILSNPAMPGVLKIGFTTRSVDQRASEISSSTGIPEPFNVEFWQITEMPEIVENAIHQ